MRHWSAMMSFRSVLTVVDAPEVFAVIFVIRAQGRGKLRFDPHVSRREMLFELIWREI